MKRRSLSKYVILTGLGAIAVAAASLAATAAAQDIARTPAPPFKLLHTYETSFAVEAANTIPVSAAKLLPLLPAEYQFVPAAALGIGGWDQGIVVVANYRFSMTSRFGRARH